MRNVILAIAMAACAAQPTTSSTEQQLCTAGDGCSWTVAEVRAAQRDWIYSQYPQASRVVDGQCHRFTQADGRSGTQCVVTISVPLCADVNVYCTGYNDGEFTCDIGDG